MKLESESRRQGAHLLSRLMDRVDNSSQQVATLTTPMGDFMAVRLEADHAVQVAMNNTEVRISVPPSVMAVLPPAHYEEFTALLVTSFHPHVFKEIFGESRQSALKGTVMAVANIDVERGTPGNVSVMEVEDLDPPMEFTLPVPYSDGVACAYWDTGLEGWSTRGVTTSADNTPGDPLICRTTHLTLFAAILMGFVNTIVCSQLTLLNMEALRELLGNAWLLGTGSMLFFGTLAFLALICACAALLDKQRQVGGTWGSEFFLLPARVIAPADGDDGKDQDEEAKAMGCLAVCGGCLPACLQWTKESSALRDAVDDCCSSWFEYFSDIRSLFEELYSAVDCSCEDSTLSNLRGAEVKVAAQLLMGTLRRVCSSSMGVSLDLVIFLLDDEDLFEVITDMSPVPPEILKSSLTAVADKEASRRQAASLTASCEESPRRSLSDLEFELKEEESPDVTRVPTTMYGAMQGRDWMGFTDRLEAWTVLHREVCQCLIDCTQSKRFLPEGLPCIIWRVFLVQNPFGATFVFDPFISCKMRAFFFMLDILGTFTISSIFFQASGIVTSKRGAARSLDCGGEDDLGWKIGHMLAVALCSMLTAAFPVALLASFHTRSLKKLDREGSEAWKRQLRAWNAQDELIWALGCCYAAFCIFFNLLFLANVSFEDQETWALSAIIALAQTFLLFPLAVSIAVPSVTWLVYKFTIALGRDTERMLNETAYKWMLERPNLRCLLNSI